MKRLFKKTDYNFISKKNIFFTLSCSLFIISIGAFILKGLNLGIDFTGGVLIQVQLAEQVSTGKLRSILSKGIDRFELQSIPLENSFIIRVKGKEAIQIVNRVKDSIGGSFTNFIFSRTEYVGPSIGEYLKKRAFWAILLSFLGIIVYVAFRFKSLIWGVSGVIALIHDVVITLGLLCLLGREITLTVIAALLTLAGYSINDTIVIFDRVRENLSLLRKESLGRILNISINQTLSRTILTSFTTELTTFSLFFFGGEVIHDFAFVLLFGVIIGTYSTIYIATGIVYEWTLAQKKSKYHQ